MSFCMSSVTAYSFKWVTMDVDHIGGELWRIIPSSVLCHICRIVVQRDQASIGHFIRLWVNIHCINVTDLATVLLAKA